MIVQAHNVERRILTYWTITHSYMFFQGDSSLKKHSNYYLQTVNNYKEPQVLKATLHAFRHLCRVVSIYW